MPRAVLDSSVLLAIVRGEPIHDAAAKAVMGAAISAVNLAEVLGKLADWQMEQGDIQPLLDRLSQIVPFSARQAQMCG